jgi:putative phosphoribosyl transferase
MGDVSFSDRMDAGKRLAGRLAHLRGEDVVVVGLPRGGVPVAAEVARALDAPLDVIVVRKLGVPFQPELGMGALGEDGVKVINRDVIAMAGVTERELAAVEARESAELRRRAERFRGGEERVPLRGRVVVVVDDGVATGSTARAACQVARSHGAERVVLAVPVAPADWTRRLADAADELVCVATPSPFFGVGQFYDDFSQTTDDEVVRHLRAAAAPAAPTPSPPATGRPGFGDDDPPVRDVEVEVEAGPVRLGGHLTVPEAARAVVVFAHGSGSGRHSPRNRYVATVLNDAGLATLLFDLLTPAEESDRANVFDIGLLGQRLVAVTSWVRQQPSVAGLPVGYFGASTGAAAALAAAAAPDVDAFAVVSRGGRPDLADRLLGSVRAPTLLIVGGRDDVVLGLNREAQARLRCPSQLTVIPGATHLFEEPGTLPAAATAARDWFLEHAPRAQTVAS